MPKKKAIKNKMKVRTPVGILSYPSVVEPDTGREFSDNKYKTDLLIPKASWKTDPDAKKLRQAVLKVGRAHFKDDALELTDFNNPFKDTDKMKKYSADDKVKGHILISAKSEFPPVIINAQKKEIPEKDAKQIKGGDFARLVVVVYPYSAKGNDGVTLGLNLLQYYKEGDALGGGRAALIEMMDEMEVEAEDPDMEENDSEEDLDDDDEEKPKSKKKAAPKKKTKKDEEEVEDEEEEIEEEDSDDNEDEEESEDDELDEEEETEEEESDDDFDFDDEDEEVPVTKKKTAKGRSKK